MRLLNISAWAIYIFLLAPIIVVLGASLTAGNFVGFPPQGLSLRWYIRALEHPQFLASLRLSLIEASLVTLLTLMLVIPAVVSMTRGNYRGQAALGVFFRLPLYAPRVVVAAALLGFFVLVPLRGTLAGLVLGHTLIACPLAFWILMAAFAGQTQNLERAAIVLGAPPAWAFFTITLRLALPAIIGAATIAFMEAFDDVPIALFLSSPEVVTLPVRIYTFVDQSLTPLVPAASSILVLIVTIAMVVIDRAVGLSRVFGIKPPT
ncbi:ABC transporter permease [Pseudochelatococcus sp. B33]